MKVSKRLMVSISADGFQGLSLLFFMLSVLGNLTYGASVRVTFKITHRVRLTLSDFTSLDQ